MAKHNRSPFRPKRDRAPEAMHTLHSDICGPYPVQSLGGGQYVVTLYDEHTSYAAIAIMRKKSEAPEQIMKMILEWEAKTGKKCKFLFSDRGGEYTCERLEKFCMQNRIVHDFSPPRTPEQNGKAERLNQTLNDMVRAMLFSTICIHLCGHMLWCMLSRSIMLVFVKD
jgi:Integrase core domain.